MHLGISARFVCSNSFKHFGIIAVIGRLAPEALSLYSATKNHTNHLLGSITVPCCCLKISSIWYVGPIVLHTMYSRVGFNDN